MQFRKLQNTNPHPRPLRESRAQYLSANIGNITGFCQTAHCKTESGCKGFSSLRTKANTFQFYKRIPNGLLPDSRLSEHELTEQQKALHLNTGRSFAAALWSGNAILITNLRYSNTRAKNSAIEETAKHNTQGYRSGVQCITLSLRQRLQTRSESHRHTAECRNSKDERTKFKEGQCGSIKNRTLQSLAWG